MSRELDDDVMAVFGIFFQLRIEGRKLFAVFSSRSARRQQDRKRRRLLCSKKTVFITMAAPEVRLCLKVKLA